MMLKFPVGKIQGIAKVFKAIASKKSHPTIGMHVSSSGRAVFIADSRTMGMGPALRVQFSLKPSAIFGRSIQGYSTYFSADSFCSAILAGRGDVATFEPVSSGDVKVTIGDSSTTLHGNGFAVADLLGTNPVGYSTENRQFLAELWTDSLVRAIDFVLPAVGSNEDSKGLPNNNILLEFHEHGCFRAISSDGHRLHRADMRRCGPPVLDDKTIQLSLDHARIVRSALAVSSGKEDKQVPLLPRVQIARCSMMSEAGESAVAEFRSVDGELTIFATCDYSPWLRYESIWKYFQWDSSDEIVLSKAQMKRISAFLGSALRGVKKSEQYALPVGFRSFQDSGIVELKVNKGGSPVVETIELGSGIPERAVCMNARMTKDALSVIESDTCKLVVGQDNRGPYLFVHRDDYGDYFSMLMPIGPGRMP